MRDTDDDNEPEGVRHPGALPKRPRSAASFGDIDGTLDEPDTRPDTGAGAPKDHTEPGFDDEPVETPQGERPAAAPSDAVHGPMKVDPVTERLKEPPPPNEGNYLFTVGRTGRGKTTFQRHLLWFLRRGSNDLVGPQYRLSSGDPNSADELAFTALESTWEREFREGRFPAPTPQAITKFHFDARPINKDLTGPIDFGFFEISGEHFANIHRAMSAATEGERDRVLAKVPKRVDRFLRSQSKIAFVFLANGLNCDEDDAAFTAFLQYLRRFEDAGFEKRTSLALVISYPEAARQRILNKIIADRGRSPETINSDDERQRALADLREAVAGEMTPEELQTQFLNAYFPKTAAEIKYWNQISGSRVNRAEVFLFSVGQVQELPNGNHKLVRAEFDDVADFFDWMFHRLTGRPMLKPRPFTALLRWLESIGSGKA